MDQIVWGCVLVLFGLGAAVSFARAVILTYDWLFGRRQSGAKSSIAYEPQGDRVIVTRVDRPQQEANTVLMPESMLKPLNEGIVVAVGPGARNRVTGEVDPLPYELGAHICFVDFAGYDVEVDGVKYLSLRDEEIHGQRPKR